MAGIKKTRKMAKKRVTKRRRSMLKLKSTAKKLFKWFKMRGGENDLEGKEIEKIEKVFKGTILRFGYCAFSVKINFGTHENPSEKVVFLQKYAPFYKPGDPQQTSKPLFDGNSIIRNVLNLQPETEGVTEQDYITFWNEKKLKDSNLPITDMGLKLNQEVTIKHLENGLKDKKDMIIKDSENCAWIVEVTKSDNDNPKIMFLTDDIMPQKALDIILAWKNTTDGSLKYFLSRRSENAEIPNVFATTAGEHLEPGDYIGDFKKKFKTSAVYRALEEEVTGNPSEVFNENSKAKLYIIPVKTYEDPGRDFRYGLFNKKGEGDSVITFGFDRYSGSVCYIAYVTDDEDFESYKVRVNTDHKEINALGRISKTIDEIKDMNVEEFMIPEHKQMFIDADAKLTEVGDNLENFYVFKDEKPSS